jgi:hypothetical protein
MAARGQARKGGQPVHGILDTERAAASLRGQPPLRATRVGPCRLGAHLGLLGDRLRHIDRRIPLQGGLTQLARRRKRDDEARSRR